MAKKIVVKRQTHRISLLKISLIITQSQKACYTKAFLPPYKTMTDYPFFRQHLPVIKPYALMDLDDTLFQTQRKIQTWQLDNQHLSIASINKQGEPLSFFTQKQAHFFNWLSQTCELIPVTARDINEIQRVKLPFNSWQILTHGAVIVDATGNVHQKWQNIIQTNLIDLQEKLQIIYQQIKNYNQQKHLGLKLTAHHDNFATPLTIYLAIKQQQKDEKLLADFAKSLPNIFNKNLQNFDENFYIHINANNLAILPKCVHKRHAVNFLLNELDNSRPCFGFGDSLADFPFLQLLDWYGTPNHGQLHEHFCQITGDFLEK